MLPQDVFPYLHRNIQRYYEYVRRAPNTARTHFRSIKPLHPEQFTPLHLQMHINP